MLNYWWIGGVWAAYISVTLEYSELVKIEILSKESYNYSWSTKNLGGQIQSALFPKENN